MGNIQKGRIDWNDLVYTSEPDEIEKYILSRDDVLFNRTNSPELVGKTAVYKAEKPAVYAGYLIRVNQIPTLCLADYLNYYLNSHPAKVYGNSIKTDGVNQSNINGEKLKSYPLPYCSLPEQVQVVQEIESRLSVCDKLSETIDASLLQAETLRQSILKKAFEGKMAWI
jgi:type I restriction enzyme S subunit